MWSDFPLTAAKFLFSNSHSNKIKKTTVLNFWRFSGVFMLPIDWVVVLVIPIGLKLHSTVHMIMTHKAMSNQWSVISNKLAPHNGVKYLLCCAPNLTLYSDAVTNYRYISKSIHETKKKNRAGTHSAPLYLYMCKQKSILPQSLQINDWLKCCSSLAYAFHHSLYAYILWFVSSNNKYLVFTTRVAIQIVRFVISDEDEKKNRFLVVSMFLLVVGRSVAETDRL